MISLILFTQTFTKIEINFNICKMEWKKFDIMKQFGNFFMNLVLVKIFRNKILVPSHNEKKFH